MEDHNPTPRPSSSIWAIPTLCLGLGIVAVCCVLPQIEANRKLAIERDKLQHDLSYVQSQLAVNDEFLQRIGQDPNLAERLAQRQMQEIREGTSVLELKGRSQHAEISPFQLVNIAPPLAPPSYDPPAGFLGKLCQDSHEQLYLTGVGMFMIAVGLVLGSAARFS